VAVKNPALLPLYEELKHLLEPYAKRFSVRVDEPGHYELWSEANMAPPGKPKREPYFAGLIIQKAYVGFYFMPVYIDPSLAESIGPDLLPTLKGKSCFYIKKLTPELREQITDALRIGAQQYEKKGWV